MANTITGRIYRIGPINQKQHGDRIYYDREVTLDATRLDPYTGEPTYPNFPQLLFRGEDRCREIESYKNGEVVMITFSLNGMKYNDKNTGEEKIFTKVEGYKIERVQRTSGATVDTSQPSAQDISDDLPF